MSVSISAHALYHIYNILSTRIYALLPLNELET